MAPVVYGVVALEGFGVLASAVGICGGAGIAGAQLSRKSVEETTEWLYWGTTVGFVFGLR